MPRAEPSQPTATTVLPSAVARSSAAVISAPRCCDHCASSAGRPTTTARPSTTPCTPRPGTFAKSVTVGSSPASAAARAIACAMGCSEASSTAPAIRSSSSVEVPGSATAVSSAMRPEVTVPVLSNTIVSMRRVRSSASGPVMRMPSCAPRPVPTSSAMGVASPSAHGQAITSTATAAVNAIEASAPAISQPTSVASATTSTIGTKMPESRSARRCASALPDCASSTSRAICASWVSAPMRVARTMTRPPALTVAPATSSPGPTSTGTDSPVKSDRSTADVPSITTPSVANFSPGRTMNSSPTASWPTGIVASTYDAPVPSGPGRRTRTSFAPSSSSRRNASPARRFARFSA